MTFRAARPTRATGRNASFFMMIDLRLLATLVVLAVVSSTPGKPAIGAPIVFPTVTGSNLNGKTFQLPRDFQAPASLVFIAYQREQQTDVDSWKSVAADLRRRFPFVGEYELPTLSRNITLFRGFIDGGMRRGIPDPATRAATITLYIDKSAFNRALDIGDERAIVIVLVKPDGTILWRTTGSYATGKESGLDAALAPLKT